MAEHRGLKVQVAAGEWSPKLPELLIFQEKLHVWIFMSNLMLKYRHVIRLFNNIVLAK